MTESESFYRGVFYPTADDVFRESKLFNDAHLTETSFVELNHEMIKNLWVNIEAHELDAKTPNSLYRSALMVGLVAIMDILHRGHDGIDLTNYIPKQEEKNDNTHAN